METPKGQMEEPSQASSQPMDPARSNRPLLLPALCAADGVLSLAMCGYVAVTEVSYNRMMYLLIAGAMFGLMGLVVGTIGLLRKYGSWAMKLGLLASTFGLVYGSWAALQLYRQMVDGLFPEIIK